MTNLITAFDNATDVGLIFLVAFLNLLWIIFVAVFAKSLHKWKKQKQEWNEQLAAAVSGRLINCWQFSVW